MTEKLHGEPESAIIRFFSKPIVGISGSIASIIGVALSIYLFLASREMPELTYFVHPAKAAVVRTQQTSRLSVEYDGQGVSSNVTAAQIAFWNAGNKPIRAADVLQRLVIRTGGKERILEAGIRKISRDVSGISLDTSRLAAGEVEITWNILEQNDGAVVQIIFMGDESVEVQASATLVGQPTIVTLKYSEELRTPGEEYVRRQGFVAQLPHYFILAIGVLAIPLSLLMVLRQRRRSGKRLAWHDWFLLAQGPILIATAIWALFNQRPPGPPFGF